MSKSLGGEQAGPDTQGIPGLPHSLVFVAELPTESGCVLIYSPGIYGAFVLNSLDMHNDPHFYYYCHFRNEEIKLQ